MAVNGAVEFPATFVPAGPACTVTVIAGPVTVAEVIAVGSATEVAVTVTCTSLAGRGGAVNVVAAPLAVAVGETLPQGAAGQDTVQVTPLWVGSLATVATSGVVPFAITVAVAGATVITTAGTVTIIVAAFVLSVAEVAVRVRLKSLAGGVVGAVYVIEIPL